MRSYMELIYFMRELGDGIRDHLPEEQRTAQLSLDQIVAQWVDNKSCLAIRSLEKDISSYIKKSSGGTFRLTRSFLILICYLYLRDSAVRNPNCLARYC